MSTKPKKRLREDGLMRLEIRVPSPLHARILEVAERRETSIAQVVRDALELGLPSGVAK